MHQHTYLGLTIPLFPYCVLFNFGVVSLIIGFNHQRVNRPVSGNRYNSEYIIIDRQYEVLNEGKKDMRYPSDRRPPKGYLSIIEVKYGSKFANEDIVKQVERYGQYYGIHKQGICFDMEKVFKQKLELGLITRTRERLDWFEDMNLVEDTESTEIILYLIDCNPSKIKELEKAVPPKFEGKSLIASGGLSLWKANLAPFGTK